jgi:hypothetical protein
MTIRSTEVSTEVAPRNIYFERLIAALKTSVAHGCAVVTSVGIRISGLTVPSDDRGELLNAIGTYVGIAILDVDGEDLAQTTSLQGDAVSTAFRCARACRDETNSWVVLYIRNFDRIGLPRCDHRSTFNLDQIAAQLLVEIDNIDGGTQTNKNIFVIVSAGGELDCAFVREGRLPEIEQVFAA